MHPDKITVFSFRMFLCLILFTFFSLNDSHASSYDSLRTELQRSHAVEDRYRINAALASLLRHSKTSEALQYGHEALRLSDSIENPGAKASVLQILGLIYNNRTDFKNAMLYSVQGLKIYEQLKKEDGCAYAYNAIGLIYYNVKKYNLAEVYHRKCLDLLIKLNIRSELPMIYNNLGNVYSSKGELKKSIQYYQLALSYAIETKASQRICPLLTNIGETYFELGYADSARVYYRDALKHAEAGHASHSIAYLNYSFGLLEMKEHNLTMAKTYLTEALERADKGGMKDLLIDVYKSLMEVYGRLRDFEKAYLYSTKYNMLMDSAYNENTLKQITEIQEGYEIEKRDKEIRLLNQQNEITEAKLNNQQLIRNFVIAVCILILVIAFVLGRNIVLKQRVKNQQLNEQNALAERNIAKLNHENTLAKYEAMKSKTDPHFLFNSLTTLSSLVNESPEQAIKYIKKFAALFRMILEISDTKLVPLEKEMEVVNSYIYLQKIRFGDYVTIQFDIPDELNKLYIPPFALQTVVENAVKHNIISSGYPLTISISQQGQGIEIRNTLQKKTSKVQSTSTGHKSIRERYRILSDAQPVFKEDNNQYIVVLPLIKLDKITSFHPA